MHVYNKCACVHVYSIPVVSVEVSVLEEDQVVAVHDLLAEHHGQELVVGHVLHQGGDDVTGFLQIESEENMRGLLALPVFGRKLRYGVTSR